MAQCKCHRKFTEKDLRDAAETFLRAQDHWNGWGITRFVIIVGSSVRDTNVQDEKEAQRKRFAEIGIEFELWGDERLVEKLKPNSDLVDVHVGATWVLKICGPNVATQLVSRAVSEAAVRGPVGDFLAECADSERTEAGRKFAAIREMARTGRVRSAFEAIEDYRRTPHWALLDRRSQGRGLRLAASLHLDFLGDTQTAEELAREAKGLAPDDNYQVIDSAVAYRREGRQAALKIVEKPVDVDAWNMKLALLVEARGGSEVLTEMAGKPFEPNANTLRIASIAALQNNDLSAAQEYARRAVEAEPGWFIVRLHAAKMKYLSTVLPHFPMLRHLSWPIPPKREYLLSDRECLAKLDQAGAEFEDLLAIMDEDDEERQFIEGWRLGCLANHPEHRREALQYARRLINSNAAHLPATVWTMERGFDIDLKSVASALVSVRTVGQPTHDELQASCAILIESASPREAVALLDERRSDFEKAGGLFFWRLLKAQAAEDAGESRLADCIAAEELDEHSRSQIRRAILRIRAQRTGDPTALCEELVNAYRREDSPASLFAAYEALVQSGRGADAVEWTGELLKQFPTVVAVTLALQANFDAGRFDSCLELIEHHTARFPDNRVPPRIMRLKAECLGRLGLIAEANALAEGLAKQEESTAVLATLFQTQVSLGDFKGCAITVRTLLQRKDVTVTGLLQMAAAIRVEDRGLAVSCWREAVKRGVESADETADAVALAFQLGLDDEAEPLMPKFCALARTANGPVRAFSLDEVREMMQEQAKQHAQAAKLFNEAQVPIHLLAASLNAPLAGMLTENMRRAAGSGSLNSVFPALIRPGTKAELWDSVPLKPGGIFMDITALYVAEEVGILELIEKKCSPVFMSADVPELIQAEIQRVSPHQPALNPPRLEVLRLVERGMLKVHTPKIEKKSGREYAELMGDEWEQALCEARRNRGVLCDFTPPHGMGGVPVILEQEDAASIVSCGDLVRALQKIGEISEEQACGAFQKLGGAGMPYNHKSALTPGTFVTLDVGIAEQLAGAKVLEPLARVFDVRTTPHAIEQLREAVAAHDLADALAVRLKGIGERLAQGIAGGRYKTFRRRDKNNEAQIGSTVPNIFERCLLDLIAAGDDGVAAVWVDDRFLLRYNSVGTVRVAGISDVLKTLHKDGTFSTNEYLQKLLALRMRNARYLPLESDEVWEHIRSATVAQGEVYETKALAVLRRYLAACFSDYGRLHAPIRGADRKVDLAEFVWVVKTLKAVADALARLWNTTSMSDSDRIAKADWLLQNLYAPFHGIIEAVSREPAHGGGVHGQAAGILLLLTAGFGLPSPWNRHPEDRNHPRARFYAWVADRLVDPCLQTEPSIAKELAVGAKRLFLGRKGYRGTKLRRQIVRGLALRVFLDLPKSVQEAVDLDVETRRWLGIRLGDPEFSITVCARKFVAAPFWRAMGKAADGIISTVRSADTNEEFQLGPARQDNSKDMWVHIEGPGVPVGHHIHDEELPLLRSSRALQRAVLENRKDWLDFSPDDRDAAISSILRLKDPAKRVFRLHEVRERSAAWFYRQLIRRSRTASAITTPECLPPTVKTLTDHLRLDIEELASRDALITAARRLQSDVGVLETIERLGSLPVLLPATLVTDACRLEDGEFRNLVTRLRQKLQSPVGKLHVLHLLAARGIVDETWLEEAKLLRDELFSGKLDDWWKVFRQMLNWTKDQMQSMHSYRDLPSTAKLVLVWLHAGRLHDSLKLAGADSECLLSAFEIWTLAHGARLEAQETDFFFDAMHPRFAGRVPVLIRGFGAVLGSLPPDVGLKLKLDHVPSAGGDRSSSSIAMLWRDHSLLRNHHASFMGGDAKALLLQAAKDGNEIDVQLPAEPSEMVIASIDELENDPTILSGWSYLAASIADSPVADGLNQRINRLLERGVEAKIFEDVAMGKFLLVFATRRAVWGIPASLKGKLEGIVWRQLETLKASSASAEEKREQVEKGLNLFLLCFAGLAIVPGDERATQLAFHRFLARIARFWPEAATILRGASRWPAYLPVANHTGYWEAAMEIRASR